MANGDPLNEAMKRNLFPNHRGSFFPAARMSDRSELNDMLNQSPETGFLGPSPSPTPTPGAPWYKRIFGGGKPSPSPTPSQSMSMKNEFVFPQVSASSLALPPRTIYRQPSAQSMVLNKTSELPVGPFELGWPAPRFNLIRSQQRSGFYNPIFQIPKISERNDEFRF